MGYLEPSFEHGALLLKNGEGKTYRLSWDEASSEATKSTEGSSRDRRRALPAGKYRLVGYRLTRIDDKDQRWDLSATHAKLRSLEIEAGETRLVQISETVTIRHRVTSKQFGLSVTGDGPAGLTLYRAGERINVEFELQDAAGETRQSGKLRYG